MFEIPALGAVGQAMELSQVADEARGIVAAWDEDSFTVRVRLDGEVGAHGCKAGAR